jgi:hypothetical protein
MKKISLTQNKVSLVDDEDYEYLMQWKWCAIKSRNTFYVVNGHSSKTIIMHRVIMNVGNGILIDHKDGDGLNNQKHNLRICSVAENARNCKKRSHNTSGYKGVYSDKTYNKHHAYIRVNGKKIYLGQFNSKIDAAKAYDSAAIEFFGEFAKTNF